MDEYKLNKQKDCIYNINDKLNALRDEINRGNPYKGYCLEKLRPIKNDVDCLIAMFEEE